MKYIVDGYLLTNIANAIRSKTGSSDKMEVSDMDDRIRSIVLQGASTYNKATVLPVRTVNALTCTPTISVTATLVEGA